MKEYKLVNSKEVQEKAFRLGYSWGEEKDVRNLESIFLFLYENGQITQDTYGTQSDQISHYLSHDNEEITQKDFLALPEHIQVGDYCLVEEGEYESVIIRVDSIDDDKVNLDEHECYYTLSQLTKLTPGQIKVLGLKEGN